MNFGGLPYFRRRTPRLKRREAHPAAMRRCLCLFLVFAVCNGATLALAAAAPKGVPKEPEASPTANPFADRLPYLVHVVVTPTSWASGDRIEVTSVHGDRPVFKAGGTYLVQGRYVLGSAFMAVLMLVPVSPQGRLDEPNVQSMHLERGRGRFALMATMPNGGPFFLEYYFYNGLGRPRNGRRGKGKAGNPFIDRVYIESR